MNTFILASRYGRLMTGGMKKTYLLSLAILSIAANAMFASKTFEGEYVMNFKGEDMNIVTTFWVKDGNLKMKHQGVMEQMGEMIMRDGMSTIIVTMPQQKTYLEMPLPMEGDFAIEEPKTAEDIPFKKTDETADMLGFTARKYELEVGATKTVVWATDELGAMPFARNQIFASWASAMRKITGLPSFFPLKTVGYRGNTETFSMTVTKVEKKELPDSVFAPPSDYRKMTLPAGMGGFIGK